MISSVCGAVGGIANVAVYSATKAFENSFGISIGKELEPYGVGVTCMMPGAVHGTEFRSVSQSQEALCWKLPFYSKSAQFVADCGVRAMLRGETEVTPGLMKRVFVKLMKPILPQRLHNLAAEIAWSPLKPPFGRKPETIKPKLAIPHRPLTARQRSHRVLMSQPQLLKLNEENVTDERKMKEETPFVPSMETASETNFDVPTAKSPPHKSSTVEDALHEGSYPLAMEEIEEKRKDVTSVPKDVTEYDDVHTSSNQSPVKVGESSQQERQSVHQSISAPDISNTQSSSVTENAKAQSSAPGTSNARSPASSTLQEQPSAPERLDSLSNQNLASSGPDSRFSASSTRVSAQSAGTVNTGPSKTIKTAQSNVAPHQTPREYNSWDLLPSFLRILLRGKENVSSELDFSAAETVPNDERPTDVFSFTAAELALKEFEKANDPTSTMFEKALVK